MRALLTTEDIQQYYGKVSYAAESISQILQVRGVETLALERVEGRYDPVAYCRAEISCKREIQSVRRPIVYKRRVAFAVTFGDHKPQIHDIVDGVSAEALSKEADNLTDSALPGINTTSARTVLSDPLVHSLLVTEACKRSRSVIHFSEVLEDWAEDGEELRARALERIREMEESETRERVARDEDRIFDLEEKIAETEADLEAHQTELAAIDGLEETARQTRHRASLQAKASRAERLVRDYRSQKSRMSERVSDDLDAIGRKYQKMRGDAVKQCVVEPETSEVTMDSYLVWLPAFQATARLGVDSKSVEMPVRWNGMSGAAELGKCKICGTTITSHGGSLCFACMHLMCELHTEKCNRCSRLLCRDDVWVCPLCDRKLCQDEQRFVCASCKTTGCLDCRFVCTHCGVHLCKDHVVACRRCGRTLCMTHKFACQLCGCAVCSSDLESCTGCKRRVCRNDFVICPRCGNRLCEQCLRSKVTVRSILGGRLRETRCVFCLRH